MLKFSKQNKGFTLIEIIVVMTVFLFVIGATISIFLSIVQRQKMVLSEQQILNQISYVEEYMSRALRMARVSSSSSDSDTDCISPGYIYMLTRPGLNEKYKGIKFINQSDESGTCQEFFLDTDGVLKELKDNDDSASAMALTSSNLKIDSIQFVINGQESLAGASDEDSVQPRVTIVLKVKIPGDQQLNPAGSTRIIQTTVSERNLNEK